MKKYSTIYGIDISKDFFDVVASTGLHCQFANTSKGFNSFAKTLEKTSLVVMEATGYYHYRLAQYLFNKGVTVSVVNLLSVKRFIHMKLSKVKTDKSDAKAICEYNMVNQVPLYNALTEVQAECLLLFRLLGSYLKKRTVTKNKLHGEKVLGIPSKLMHQSPKRNLKHLNKEIEALK
ncbi:transposase [Mesonia maritima]|uniref:Transposase n=1 Tax=Mesonia maritima TaxID=1793873 RepID=A0ABU1K4T8_9FLAO|nr:transposase [Mesonia maritima]